MKIPALRIEVNGTLVAIAGAEGLSMLTATIGYGSGSQKFVEAGRTMLGVIGVDVHAAQPRQLNWATAVKLKEGDKVTFEFVQVEQATTPDKIVSSPSTAQLRAEASRK